MPREQMFADKHDSWGASLQAYAKERVTPAWGDTPAPPKDKRVSRRLAETARGEDRDQNMVQSLVPCF